jgi:enoyl-CoA hydratase/carnithine racemase
MLSLVSDGAIATLTIDRAEKKNAITLAMWQAFPALIGRIEQDDAIRAVIVTGRGTAFAAGADIGEFTSAYATRLSAASYVAAMGAAQDAIMRCVKPTIAMIRGACIGAGCGIALSCDIRFADPSARFGITPAKLGMIYSLADSKRLTDAVGIAAAHALLLSGALIDAAEAGRIGMVNRVVPSEALEATTRAFAETIAGNSAASVRGIKAILTMIRDGATQETDASRALFLDILEQPDFAEGQAAFRDKRPPRF